MRYNWNPIEKCAVQLESYRNMCGTTGTRWKNVRQNWIPIVQSKSGSAAHAAGESQSKSAGAGRDGPNIRYCEPTKILGNPGKSPIQRRPGRTAAGRENPQSNADPAGPPPAGKIPKPNRLVTAVIVATRESRLCRQKCAVQLGSYRKMCGTTGIL